MNTNIQTYNLTKNIHGVDVTFETGKMAFRTDSCIFAKAGDTTVLVTVVVDKNKSDSDFFPLTIEYVEKHYASGRITSNRFKKREGINDGAILKGRAIDRAVRPLFPKDFRLPVQIIIQVMSYDMINDPQILAANAVSVALMQSSIPFKGPVATTRVILNNGIAELTTKITDSTSKLDLLFSGFGENVSMIEVEAKQIDQVIMKNAFKLAVEGFKVWEEFQQEFFRNSPKTREKMVLAQNNYNADQMKTRLGLDEDKFISDLKLALYTDNDETYQIKIDEVKSDLNDKNNQLIEDKYKSIEIEDLIYKYSKKITREGILFEGKRLSGRAMDEIRQLYIETGLIPRVHGSALFTRGITQALSIVTLGSMKDCEYQETLLGEESKYYIHHYNGSGFSLGDASKFSMNPGRREIGHGELAEKALKAVLPTQDIFPYTIRVVSEVLSQSGSSSMASTCGSTLALMDAGVPITAPVAGVAIGLITEDNYIHGSSKYQLVVDMADKEDFFGDMDFKVTGSHIGITAIQMDNKLGGVHLSILIEGLSVANTKLNELLFKIGEVLPSYRDNLSTYAPIVFSLNINPAKIGMLIGPGGKHIKQIVEDSKAEVTTDDDGKVTITAKDTTSLKLAQKMINRLVGEVEIGKTYDARVGNIKEFGIFVDFPIGDEGGLVHKSELHSQPDMTIEQLYPLGKIIRVKVLGRDSQGRLQLSAKQAE